MNTPNDTSTAYIASRKTHLRNQRIEKPLSPLRAVAVMVGGGVTIGCVWMAIIWIFKILWP